MFETAELGQKVSKEEYKKQVGPLRDTLLDLQQRAREAKLPVVIVIAGVDGAGKGETVNALLEWFDPRGIEVTAPGEASDEERERPPFWRFWRALPPSGRIGVFLGSWYTEPIVNRVHRRIKRRQLGDRVQDIQAFEKMLADDGALILKFWFHLSRKAQQKRLKSLESDPLTRWRVTASDWRNFRLYNEFRKVSEEVLRSTSTGQATWHVVEGADHEYRNLEVGRRVVEEMTEALASRQAQGAVTAPMHPIVEPLPAGSRSILSKVDYAHRIDASAYKNQLERLQGRLNQLGRELNRRRRSAVLVFEGPDAAGKGGTIRRITEAVDARYYKVVPIAAPTDEERSHHYLWRFWRHLPRDGRLTIFDRSWYGRVLVEPAEGYCTNEAYERAFAEINDYENNLIRHGTLVLKFWLAVTKEEQLRRFKERETVSFKRFKIGPDDYRNRDKWEIYESLVHRMVEHTSTAHAPWNLVPNEDKETGRIVTLETLCGRLQEALDE